MVKYEACSWDSLVCFSQCSQFIRVVSSSSSSSSLLLLFFLGGEQQRSKPVQVSGQFGEQQSIITASSGQRNTGQERRLPLHRRHRTPRLHITRLRSAPDRDLRPRLLHAEHLIGHQEAEVESVSAVVQWEVSECGSAHDHALSARPREDVLAVVLLRQTERDDGGVLCEGLLQLQEGQVILRTGHVMLVWRPAGDTQRCARVTACWRTQQHKRGSRVTDSRVTYKIMHTLYCQKYWHPLLMNRFDYFSNFYEYKS